MRTKKNYRSFQNNAVFNDDLAIVLQRQLVNIVWLCMFKVKTKKIYLLNPIHNSNHESKSNLRKLFQHKYKTQGLPWDLPHKQNFTHWDFSLAQNLCWTHSIHQMWMGTSCMLGMRLGDGHIKWIKKMPKSSKKT